MKTLSGVICGVLPHLCWIFKKEDRLLIESFQTGAVSNNVGNSGGRCWPAPSLTLPRVGAPYWTMDMQRSIDSSSILLDV